MSLTSTLSSVADRFVSRDEIDNLRQFVESIKENLPQQYESLQKVIESAENKLNLDSVHLFSFKSHLEMLKNQRIDYRLDDHVEPVHYDLTVTPHLENFTFDGSVAIRIKAKFDGISAITLMKENLCIKSVNLQHNGREIALENQYFNEITDKWTLALSENLIKNEVYALQIDYSGIIGEGREGLFRSSYQESGKRKWLISTQFQPTKSRNVFPGLWFQIIFVLLIFLIIFLGFDEPRSKTTFTLTIIRPSYFKSSLSNTNIDTYFVYDRYF